MINVAIPQEERQALTELAHQERRSVDALIQQILREGIEKRKQVHHPKAKAERLQALTRIKEHRKAFLTRRNNAPIDVDPTMFLDQIRDERDQHLFSLAQERNE